MRLDDPDASQTRANLKPAKPNEDGTYRYILSDESMDSYSTRIMVRGWTLKRFLANPVVPWAHRYDIPPVGRAERAWKSVESGQPQLLMDVRFMRPQDYGHDWPAGLPSPVAIEAMTAAGYLRGCSVGMRPLEWEYLRKAGADGKDDPRGEVVGIEYRKQELLEGSIVPIPSNANALARCLTEGHLTLAQLPEVYRAVDLASSVDPEMVECLRREMDSPRLFALGGLRDAVRDGTLDPTSNVLDEIRAVGDAARALAAGLPAPPVDGKSLAEILHESARRLSESLRLCAAAGDDNGNPDHQG